MALQAIAAYVISLVPKLLSKLKFSLEGVSSFKSDLVKKSKSIIRRGHDANQQIARELFAEIVSKTPKDTGFASSKWEYTINSRPPSSFVQRPAGGYSPATTPTFTDFKKGDKLYIYNTVKYVEYLERGWSKQAPANFVKNAVSRADKRLQSRYNSIS